jgi:hypothetical protein
VTTGIESHTTDATTIVTLNVVGHPWASIRSAAMGCGGGWRDATTVIASLAMDAAHRAAWNRDIFAGARFHIGNVGGPETIACRGAEADCGRQKR